MSIFRGIFVGRLNAERCGDHQKKKFFINKSAEALVPLKERYQGLLKLHVPLGVFQREGGNRAISKNEILFEPEK